MYGPTSPRTGVPIHIGHHGRFSGLDITVSVWSTTQPLPPADWEASQAGRRHRNTTNAHGATAAHEKVDG